MTPIRKKLRAACLVVGILEIVVAIALECFWDTLPGMGFMVVQQGWSGKQQRGLVLDGG